ncbi:hypothetical protein DSO57_1023571 [Entomophthora muscae]|uniref:Uncharacterized protein n=1 Tax=Entomophthora muscae TaxID=34485 RepID=A0ACC2T2N4_9FUNG|nr:hypothetical protein DSO57_1023571 [Entomophthora muscae]
MLEIPTTPSLSTVPPAQDFILGLANQVVPHTGNWQSLATAFNYLARIAPIVYLAFQARPASPAGVQLDSGMGNDRNRKRRKRSRKFGLSIGIGIYLSSGSGLV